MTNLEPTQPSRINPFVNNRVDTPFQNHADVQSAYQEQFARLRAILNDIKQDPNHQSQGIIITGEPGSGKTHLMMRLAKECLERNRLLFIRQPNNPDSILFHIYSRILESLVIEVPGTGFSQLEHFMAKSLSSIVEGFLKGKNDLSQNEINMRQRLMRDPMNIFRILGPEGSDQYRKNWRYIEIKALQWLERGHAIGGYQKSILAGLIRFCSYRAQSKREAITRWLSGSQFGDSTAQELGLEVWQDKIDPEAFALEAMIVLSHLSLEDEPMIIVFDQLEGLKNSDVLLYEFGEAIREVFTYVRNSMMIVNLFPERWEHYRQVWEPSTIDRLSQNLVLLDDLSRGQLLQILKKRVEQYGLKLENLFTHEDLEDILSTRIVRKMLNRASDYYRYRIHHIPLPKTALHFETEVRNSLRLIQETVLELKRWIGDIKSLPASSSEGQRSEETTMIVAKESSPTDGAEGTETRSSHTVQKASVEETRKEVLPAESNDQYAVLQYFETTLNQLTQSYSPFDIISDTDDIGKLHTVMNAFSPILGFRIESSQLSQKLPKHIILNHQQEQWIIGFLNVDGILFRTLIKNFNDMAEKNRSCRCFLLRDQRRAIPEDTEAMGEIERLERMPNGRWISMNQENRICFELIYHLVVDIQNRDLEADLEDFFSLLAQHLSAYWLIEVLDRKRVK